MRNHSIPAPFWAAGGAASSALAQAAVLSSLAWLDGAEALGRYALAAAVVAPIMLLARLQLRVIAAAQASSARSRLVFFRARLLVSGCAVALLVQGAWIFFPTEIAATVGLLAVSRFLEDLAELSWGFLQRDDRWAAIATSQALHGVGTAAMFGVVFTVSLSLPAALAAGAMWHAVVFAAHDVRRLGPASSGQQAEVPWSAVAALVRECGWLGPAAALVSLNGHLPRLALERWDSLEAVGVFAALSQFALAGNLAVQALGQVRLRSLAETAREDPKVFGRILLGLTVAALVVGALSAAAAAIVGELALAILFGPALSGYGAELAWLLAASTFLYLAGVWGYAWVALGERRAQFLVYALAVLCGFLAAVAWTPEHGLRGAIAAYGVGWGTASAGCLWGIWSRLAPLRQRAFAPTSPARYN